MESVKYISGPASWYYFEWNGCKFILFGDQHRSLDHDCEHEGIPCSYLNENLEEENVSSDCQEISLFLYKHLQAANRNHLHVDVLAEIIPYSGHSHYRSVFPVIPVIDVHEMNERRRYLSSTGEPLETERERLRDEYNGLDYLHSIEYVLLDFPVSKYVHFYPMDIRWLSNSENATIAAYSFYYIESILSGIPEDYPDPTETTNIFYEEFIPIAKELFDIYLWSDDFVNEADELLQPMVELLQSRNAFDPYAEELLRVVDNIRHHTIDGRSVVGQELYLLRQKNILVGGINIADAITNYMQEKVQEINLEDTLLLWRYYYEREADVYFFDNSDVLFNVLILDILLVDTYVLAKMFNIGGTGEDGGAKEVIVYMGIRHINNYVDFFEYINVFPIAFIEAKPEKEFSYGRCLSDVRW